MSLGHLENGINFITEAIELDKSENYREALELYKGGIQALINAIKYESTSVREKDIIKNKCRECLNRAELIKDKLGKKQDTEIIDDAQQKMSDALDSVLWCKSPIKINDIIGLEGVKEKMKEGIILPLKYPQLFTRGLQHPRHLLFGPPGTGKTLMAKAVGTETGCKCLFVSAVKLSQPYQDSERLMKALFTRAREIKPVVIFIDDIDALFPHPDCETSEQIRRVRTELLVQMEGIGQGNKGIHIFAATNCPQAIIPSFRKRFSHRVYFPLPNQQERSRMAKKCLTDSRVCHVLDEEDFNVISEKTEGYTCFDISNLMQYASVELFREARKALYFQKIMPRECQNVNRSWDITRNNTQNCSVLGAVGSDVGSDEMLEKSESSEIQCPKTEGDISQRETISKDETTATKERNQLGPVTYLTCDNDEQNVDKINPQKGEDNTNPPEKDVSTTNSPSLGSTHHHGYCYTPCSPEMEGALKLNPSDITDEILLPPPLTLDCVLNSLTKVKSSVDKTSIDDNLQFKKDFVDL